MAKLQLTSVGSPERLRPVGSGLYQTDARLMAARRPANATLAQGAVEQSTVDAGRPMMDIPSAAGPVNSNLRMISLYDSLMERAVSLGRVA